MGGCVRKIGHEHEFCQAQKAENTNPARIMRLMLGDRDRGGSNLRKSEGG